MQPDPIIELGPGTGAITNALIERGVDPAQLVLVEYNPGFCALLRDRYPTATVVQGDAYSLRESLWQIVEDAGIRGRLRPAAGDQADAPAREAAARGAGAVRSRRALHPVHLFRRAADPEIAAGRFDARVGTNLVEHSARAGLGLSQGIGLFVR